MQQDDIAGDMQAEYDLIISAIGGGVPDAEQYRRLASLTVMPRMAVTLNQAEPFSADYAEAAFDLYLAIRGKEAADYVPARDEASPAPLPDNLFTGVVPWSFRDPALVAEFLLSWGQMLRALGLPAGAPLSVLEYGPGSGQLLLVLARLGFEAYGVDINADALAAITAQATHMGLSVRTEQAEFGEGFAEERFDRILFFEAFHHAFDFMALLRKLRTRLKPGGKLVLCGEPITSGPSPSIPYPWGPRLDGLSAFCINRFGWMELGFTWPFLREAMRRTGWRVRAFPMPGCGRADCYVAIPMETLQTGEVWRLDCGDARAGDALDGDGWSVPEGTHRWTVGPEAQVILPAYAGAGLAVELLVANYLPVVKTLAARCGDQRVEATVPPGTPYYEIRLDRCTDGVLEIDVPVDLAAELMPGADDARMLGIAVLEVRATALPFQTPPAAA